MIAKFTGWVPTITGNLSFSTIGLARSPRRSFSFFRKLGQFQWTVVVQRRNKSDTLFSRILDPLLGRRAKHFFCLVGRSEHTDSWETLTGHVFICSPVLFKTALPLLHELRLAGNDSNGALHNDDIEALGLESFLDLKRKRIENWLDRFRDRLFKESFTSECFLVGFRLKRDGLLEITLDKSIYFSSEEADTIALQSYFFIKDIAHAHQHHNRNSDTILETYEDCPDGAAWRRETMYALYKWIIHRKREKSEISYTRAAGVLAYARAFSLLHLKGVRRPEDVPDYLFDEVQLSLEAGQKEASARSIEESSRLSFRAWLTAFLGTVALTALAVIFQLPAEAQSGASVQRQILFSIIDHVSRYPIGFLVSVLAISWAFGQLSRPRTRLFSRPLVLDVLRLAYSMNFWFVFGLLGLALAGLFYLIVSAFLWGLV